MKLYTLKPNCFFIIINFITSYIQVRSATATIQIFSLSLTKKSLELKNERGKADCLLFETLPRHIAIEYTQVDDYGYLVGLKIDLLFIISSLDFSFISIFIQFIDKEKKKVCRKL